MWNRKKNWDIAFPKDSGILFPVPDEDGLYQALQIRMDEEKSGRKYLWLSSAGYPHGVSSRSVAAYFGDMDGEVAVTEGALKAYCAWCFSGKPFIGIPGVGQTACLEKYAAIRSARETTYRKGAAVCTGRVGNTGYRAGEERGIWTREDYGTAAVRELTIIFIHADRKKVLHDFFSGF